MCVLAGAGTGKTRAITHRIAYAVHSGQVQPQRVLALTFTARAAGEMRTRLRQLGVAGVQARTFHSAALRQLHFFWPQAVGGAAPEILSQKASAVAEAAGRLRLQFDRTTIRDLAGEIEWAKVNLLDPASYVAGARAARREPPGLDLTAMARLFEAYGEVLQRRGVIDFEDVLLTTVGILDDRDDIARAVRGQYRSFVVDEYQDVNAVQQRLLDVWLGERDDLVVVGDPSQTIYSFTGASPRHLLGFTNRFPKAHVVRLVRNYRSTPQIVTLANTVIGSGPEAVRSGALRLVSEGAPGPAPLLSEYPDDPAEAVGVADRIRRLVDGGHPAAEIAVLFRINAQSEAFESALTDAGVPYLVRGGERFFARKEVRAAILLLRGAARGDDGEKPLGHLVRDVITGAGWAEQPPAGSGATRERWESLNALAAEADNLAVATPEARLPELVAELDRRAAEQHAPVVQSRVGRRLSRRCLRGAHPHLDGRWSRRDRRGETAALRRPHPGSPRAVPVVVGCPQPRWPPGPKGIALPGRGHRHPRRRRSHRCHQGQRRWAALRSEGLHPANVPGMRRRTDERGAAQGRPL